MKSCTLAISATLGLLLSSCVEEPPGTPTPQMRPRTSLLASKLSLCALVAQTEHITWGRVARVLPPETLTIGGTNRSVYTPVEIVPIATYRGRADGPLTALVAGVVTADGDSAFGELTGGPKLFIMHRVAGYLLVTTGGVLSRADGKYSGALLREDVTEQQLAAAVANTRSMADCGDIRSSGPSVVASCERDGGCVDQRQFYSVP